MIQDTTTPSLPLFPDLNLPVNREQIASANTEARADELRAAPTPSGGQDLALAVHPHPTLSETLMEAAEVFYGYATHTMAKRKAEGK